MLGHVALSETPISSISKILEGNAEMSGLLLKQVLVLVYW